MSEEEDDPIYCICRSSDVSRFMIGCDHCEEWYHGDCINVTAKESKYIKKFYCKECTDKNADLKIVYKSKYMDKVLKMQEENESKQKKEKKKEKKKHKERDKERSRSRERHKHKDKKHKKDKSREKDEKHKEEKKEKEVKKEREDKKSRKIISDSDDEVGDKDEEKQEKERQKLDLEKKLKEEKERKHKERQKEKEIERERQKLREEKRKEKDLEDKIKKEVKEKKEKVEKIKQEQFDTPTRKPLQVKDIQNISKYDSAEEWKPVVTVTQPQKRKAGKESGPNKRKRACWPEYDSSDDEEGVDLAPRQCYSMDCVNCARVGSKYCSDQCGLTLASYRIYQTLPDRIREWNMTPCQAEQKNRKELERIREDIQKAKQRLEEVDREAEMLEEVIAKGKTMSIIENKSDDSSEDEDESKGTGVVNCITCGKDVTARTAIRHMESCFNKFESQTSFGSMYKTRIEGYQMFCDFYNSSTGTYCKRLRVICPEHTKDQKISDTEVCGYPLTKDLFKSTGEFCRLPRKVCHDHYSWEKLKRAELDMDRVRQWLKIDELLEKERHEKESMSRRAGVLNLLLHSTFNHEIAALMQQKKARAAAAGQQQPGTGSTSGQHQSVRLTNQSGDKSRKYHSSTTTAR